LEAADSAEADLEAAAVVALVVAVEAASAAADFSTFRQVGLDESISRLFAWNMASPIRDRG
jgi:hypothetical protein